MESLFGEEFEIKIKKPRAKDVLKKLDEIDESEVDVDKLLKSKSVSLNDKLRIITDKVYRVLGKQIKNVVVLKTKDEYFAYIDKAIELGRIDVDTETNNSLDAVTCKLMGLCLYAPGQKQAYIPVNHVDPNTNIRLSWQLTEEDIKAGLVKIVLAKQLNPNFLVIMHNGKFDYCVLKCTCGVAVIPDWDTMVAARLLNENEKAGLKDQYVSKIDPDQEKYSIEHLFTNIPYAVVDPKVFALYAATDAMMTDKLYEYQVVEMAKPEYGAHMDITGKHQIKGLRWLFHNVEMPIVIVTAEMELRGVCVDQEFGEKLQIKYNTQLEQTDDEINKILIALKPTILKWSLTPAATNATRVYVPKKSKMAEEKIIAQYPNVDDDGNRYKVGKSKASQLTDPVNLASPVQLAILFYDVLNISSIYNKDTRGTGKTELKEIAEKLKKFVEEATREQLERAIEADNELGEDEETDDDGNIIKSTEQKDGVDDAEEVVDEDEQNFLDANTAKLAADLCVLLLKRRGLAKLLTTYIDVIPTLAKHWPDNRIRFHLNSLGTDTGRYSSGGKWKFPDAEGKNVQVSGINIQNIPSHNPEIRMLFKAQVDEGSVDVDDDNEIVVPEITEVETTDGFRYCRDLTIHDKLLTEEGEVLAIKNIIYNQVNKEYIIQL